MCFPLLRGVTADTSRSMHAGRNTGGTTAYMVQAHAPVAVTLLLLFLLALSSPWRTTAAECRQVQDRAGAPVYSALCGGTLIQYMPFCTRVDYMLMGVKSCPDNTCWIEMLVGGQSRWMRQAAACNVGSTVATCPAYQCTQSKDDCYIVASVSPACTASSAEPAAILRRQLLLSMLCSAAHVASGGLREVKRAARGQHGVVW
jgi:hypothetical protein